MEDNPVVKAPMECKTRVNIGYDKSSKIQKSIVQPSTHSSSLIQAGQIFIIRHEHG
jgi:uncharacterized protein YcgI (DUF1989 family)